MTSGGPTVFAAIDLGASGGRVIAGVMGGPDGSARPAQAPVLHVVHRFANQASAFGGHLRWDFEGLFEQILLGLGRLAREFGPVRSIGVDTWGVDYGLLDDDGALLAPPVSYRDQRNAAAVPSLHARCSPERLYAVNGLQELSFTTYYQLEAERNGPLWDRAAHALLLPDLIAYRLTGVMRTEVTNASTTGLLDAGRQDWSPELFDALDLPRGLFPPLVRAGEVLGPIRGEVAARAGLAANTLVTAVGSHDTASAVVAVPATSPRFAYVSCGTWSLAGLELDAPVLTDEARAANITNEGGVDGRIRFLRNIGGLWLLQESMRHWAEHGDPQPLEPLLAEAARLPAGGPTVAVGADAFLAPGQMPRRIAEAVRDAGAAAGQVPSTPAQTTRVILDSLALEYARTVALVDRLSGRTAAGRPTSELHIVGGGARNALLAQATADAAGIPVITGPEEATAMGNVLVQARAHDVQPGGLEDLRAVLAAREPLRRFTPSGA